MISSCLSLPSAGITDVCSPPCLGWHLTFKYWQLTSSCCCSFVGLNFQVSTEMCGDQTLAFGPAFGQVTFGWDHTPQFCVWKSSEQEGTTRYTCGSITHQPADALGSKPRGWSSSCLKSSLGLSLLVYKMGTRPWPTPWDGSEGRLAWFI
jgi:hypothetical protein